ncbi:hypothetical protein GGI07_001828 [Coemansia sp. Benny D115]|nr:hypothetical protein GGI07_001828 [Coemansia sp. Benny D115]
MKPLPPLDKTGELDGMAKGDSDQPQYARHVEHRNNSMIDSDYGGNSLDTMPSSISSNSSSIARGSSGLQQRNRAQMLAGAGIPVTAAGSGPGGWPGDGSELMAGRRRALAQRRFWKVVLHLLKVIVLSIIVILLLAAVGIPVSDNGMPQAGSYEGMTFDWRLDPRSYLKPMDPQFTEYNVLLDAHMHTTYSDGVLTPKQAVDFAIANGYNAVIVTDHQTVEGGLAARRYAEDNRKGQITVIPGMEYTCCRIHMNLIGINESIPVHPPSPSDAELQAVIERVHRMGGLVIVNHIPWSNTTLLPWDVPRLPNQPSREQLLSWGVDGFEVVNQNTFDLRSYQFVQDNSDRLVGLTGSDMHYPGSSYAWTTINATSLSADDIMEEIRSRRTSFLLDASGTRPIQDPPYNKAYFRYAPWGLIGDYFYGYADRSRGQYSFQATFCQDERVDVHNAMIGWFFLWLLVSIAVLELLYWFFRWLILLGVRSVHRRLWS